MTVVIQTFGIPQNFICHKWLIESIKLRLTDQFKQKSYRLFKSDYRFEKYLDVLNDKIRFTFCRFRTSNHRLPIEVRRCTNVELIEQSSFYSSSFYLLKKRFVIIN